jgi:hypothetical protein
MQCGKFGFCTMHVLIWIETLDYVVLILYFVSTNYYKVRYSKGGAIV